MALLTEVAQCRLHEPACNSPPSHQPRETNCFFKGYFGKDAKLYFFSPKMLPNILPQSTQLKLFVSSSQPTVRFMPAAASRSPL